ncbi:MAG: hypothetical protein H6617_01055 [Bdellovibrionaceae bacterium]|nr:hypothetical protein [Bdellovibrionales bacterium]MCB9253253.1 hypothetical protein [Pseudobdellovibrionaceae bacterium]
MSRKFAWLLIVGMALALTGRLEAKSPHVQDWILVAVELQEHPVEIPDFETLSLATKLRKDGDSRWLDFQFSGKALPLAEGYKVVASWSSDAAFDGHSLRLRRALKPNELSDLADGKLSLSIRALDHGYFRFEFWSPRGIRLSQSDTRSF